MAERASVIFIREWEQQMSSSGCCGRLEGDFLTRGGEPVFPERRAVMESLGPLYCDVRRRYGARAEVQVIDPRNFVGLLALLVRDFWAYRVGARDVLRTLTRLPTHGVVVNGRVFSRGWPERGDLLAALDDVVGVPPARARG